MSAHSGGSGLVTSDRPFGAFVDSRLFAVGFFLFGVGAYLIWKSLGDRGLTGESIVEVFRRAGWVSVPLAIAAVFLVRSTVRHVAYRLQGRRIAWTDVKTLIKIEAVSTKLGILGTLVGIIAALTANYAGLSATEARIAMNTGIGMALYSTAYGVSLGLLADVQVDVDAAPEDEGGR